MHRSSSLAAFGLLPGTRTRFGRCGVGGVSHLTALLLAASLAGCAGDDAQQAEAMDIAEVQSELDQMSDNFQLVNTKRFPSQVADARLINVWANSLARGCPRSA